MTAPAPRSTNFLFAADDEGQTAGFVFKNPFIGDAPALQEFSRRVRERLGVQQHELGFATAAIAVSFAYPNHTNGVLLNQAALVPAYSRREDEVAQGILRNDGYQVYPIDCSNIILTNSAIHCISKTAPQTRYL